MKRLILSVSVTLLCVGVTYYITKQLNPCECYEIREKQILTQLEIDLIHVKRVQQNWDRHLK
jgi:hypothetical protein